MTFPDNWLNLLIKTNCALTLCIAFIPGYYMYSIHKGCIMCVGVWVYMYHIWASIHVAR